MSFALLSVVLSQYVFSLVDVFSQETMELSLEIEENSEEGEEENRDLEEIDKLFFINAELSFDKQINYFFALNLEINSDFEYKLIDPPPEFI